ncbi:ABC transporter permease [Luteimicrobium subarcticum]|uniref:Transport permease protein n=1 Tax=Luteimicrobium subarcticum TaxID=620910 RepID=A0A2M8WTJ2_9MICO|nr:ABC transporter permease [Luteimicrobium subarcticum]PJI94265.1 teichoic acid transport system permease protein [Luteimicrobium subarcticum]
MRTPSSEELAALAEENGLRPFGERQSLREYSVELWRRRSFLWTLAKSRSYNRNQDNYLGQMWSVLNPLFLAGVYYLIFGVLLKTTHGVDNFVGFLVIGVFTFSFVSTSMTSGAGSVSNSLSLVRSLRFPRAVLPLSVTVAELVTFGSTVAVMLFLVLLSGERPTWSWFGVVPAFGLAFVFVSGVAMMLSRMVASARDLRNLIPVGIRFIRYFSGVFFSIDAYVVDKGFWGQVMLYQPVAVYLNLARSALLEEFDSSMTLWLAGAGWALLAVVVGYVVFWRGEEQYGRE